MVFGYFIGDAFCKTSVVREYRGDTFLRKKSHFDFKVVNYVSREMLRKINMLGDATSVIFLNLQSKFFVEKQS